MENNIKKLYAVILDRKFIKEKETGANCKVYQIEEGSQLITDQNIIKKLFPDSGNIFSSVIFSGTHGGNLKIGDLIEIPLDEISPKKEEESRSTYIKHQPVKKIGFKVIDFEFQLSNNDYLDIEKITETLAKPLLNSDALGKFYLSDSQYLYGPFKIENVKISPAVGKSVSKYNFDIDQLIDIENTSYSIIIQEPKNKISEVDCMSKIQIIEHLKITLNTFQNINIEANKLRDLKDAIIKNNDGAEGLNAIRLSRANKYLSELELSYEEINKLKANNEAWELIFNANYHKHKIEFEKDFFKDIEGLKKKKESEIAIIKQSIIDNDKKVAKQKQIIEDITKDIQEITLKKEDLILGIKVGAGINENKSLEKTKFYEYHENLNTGLPFHSDFDDYMDDLTEAKIVSREHRTIFSDGLHCLKNGNFILANNLSYVTTLIKSLGNFKIIQQNTEIDWIKFDFIYENGFKEIAFSAVDNQSIPHFYILQDINIASFECYAKPIIDLANGNRKLVPGLNINWPSNLFFIAIPIEIDIEDFGFKLESKTFNNWQFFPFIGTIFPKVDINLSKLVDFNHIEINEQANNYLEKYFS